jgi:threonine dehydratase
MPILSLYDIYNAHHRIAPYILHTPLQHSALLSAQLGCDVWLKMENRQHTGSFKPRGALNKIMSLSDAERSRGIVAASAGNHALGVAHAAKMLNLPKTDVFVQANAALAKIAKLQLYPVNLHLAGQTFEEAQQAALAHAALTGATFVSAYDDVDVIAGQGTVGLEIMQALPDADTIVVPIGGGGLIAGTAIAAKTIRPSIRIIGVNPEASPSAYLSRRDGVAYDPYDHGPTLAHGLAGGFGRVPFAVGMMLIDDIVLVSEDEMKRGIAALIDSDQVLLEASGAASVAAVLAHKIKDAGKCVVVLSGGNIDVDTLRSVLSVNEYAPNQRISSTNETANQRIRSKQIKKTVPVPLPKLSPEARREWLKQRPGQVETPNDSITYQLNGLAFNIHNDLGPGHRESTYHDAFAAKLAKADLAFLDEPEIIVELEDGTPVHKYVPDFIIEEVVVVELKAQHWPMSNDDVAQVFDYFAATDCEEAMFYNFGRPRLDCHRLLRPTHIEFSHQRRSKEARRDRSAR